MNEIEDLIEYIMMGTNNYFSAKVMTTPCPEQIKMPTVPYYDRLLTRWSTWESLPNGCVSIASTTIL